MMTKHSGSDQTMRCASTSTGGTVSNSLKNSGTKPQIA